MTHPADRTHSALTRLDADPYGQMARRKRFVDELASIRSGSRYVWSRPDTSLTTHGHYYANPEQATRTLSRPTSSGRKNNPHPNLVFMRTGMREIPDAYGAPASRAPSREAERSAAVPVPPYWEQLQDLSPVERQGVNAFIKAANEDSKMHVVEALHNYRAVMSNDYECPPIGSALVQREDGSRTEFYPSMDRFRQAIRNDKEFTAINQVLENPATEVKLTSTQPPVVQRRGRFANRPANHFQRRSHSHSHCPWPLARHPYRGDYSIHMDWHPRLPHHGLTCLC